MKRTMTLIAFLVAAIPVAAQTYNSNTGGYNTGYGTMYGSFGMAMASQNMYNTMQMIQTQNMLRAANIKRHGKAAVEKAEREAAATSSGKSYTSASGVTVSPRRVPRNYGKFRPDATVDTARLLGEMLGSTPEEKALLGRIYKGIKEGYDKEVAAKGWQNNFAGAFTFFIVSNATVYHDSPDPSDDTVLGLYETMNELVDSIPEFGKMSNRDKQAFNNMLIAFAAIPLATYTEGKQNGDAATLKAARDLAGQLLEMVLKADPEKIRFENGSLVLDN